MEIFDYVLFGVLWYVNVFAETHLIPKLKETAELTLATINRNRQSLIEQVKHFIVVIF